MGGAQSLLVEMAPLQSRMGNDVTILQLKKTTDLTLLHKLKDEKVKILSLSSTRSVRNPINVFTLFPYMRAYDVVHVHLFPAQYWAAFSRWLSFSKIPLITTEHSTENKRRKSIVYRFIDNIVYRFGYKKVVACSDKALETFKRVYPKVSAIAIPNGVNITKYADAKPYLKQQLLGVPEDTFIVAMVARFEYPKRQDTIIKAISLLPPNVHVVFVGNKQDDRNYEFCFQLSKELGVKDRVHFIGIRSDVPRILQSVDVVIMSSEYEGLSLSSIEGMAARKPFIATNVNGLREVVGGAGILFDCGNAKQLAINIENLKNNEKLYHNIANQCFSRAMEYGIHRMVTCYQKVYDDYAIK